MERVIPVESCIVCPYQRITMDVLSVTRYTHRCSRVNLAIPSPGGLKISSPIPEWCPLLTVTRYKEEKMIKAFAI